MQQPHIDRAMVLFDATTVGRMTCLRRVLKMWYGLEFGNLMGTNGQTKNHNPRTSSPPDLSQKLISTKP